MNCISELLRAQHKYVITDSGVDWFDYNGFMMPAYLPHCCPLITMNMAEKIIRISGRPFARWDVKFGQINESPWWYILKKGSWQIDSVPDKKKRWMIRQGQKNFSIRILTKEEILSLCPSIAQKAAARYKGNPEVETHEMVNQQLSAAEKVPGAIEYIGCFYKETLVSFSENHIQNNAVFLANIRHDPAFLNKYSSYGLMNGLLEYYLNEKQFCYVFDGSRSIYHKTQFQDHLIKVFGFTKEYALLNVVYSKLFWQAVRLTYPFRSFIEKLADKTHRPLVGKTNGILIQEYIRRECMKQVND